MDPTQIEKLSDLKATMVFLKENQIATEKRHQDDLSRLEKVLEDNSDKVTKAIQEIAGTLKELSKVVTERILVDSVVNVKIIESDRRIFDIEKRQDVFNENLHKQGKILALSDSFRVNTVRVMLGVSSALIIGAIVGGLLFKFSNAG